MQTKFCGYSYISSSLTTLPSILADSCFPTPWTCESFCLATLQFFSLSDSSNTTSDISYADPGLGNGPICWLIGAWPKFQVDLAKQILVLLALSAIVCRARTKVSPEVICEGARTRFPHPGYVWWVQVVHGLTLCTSYFAHSPVPRNLRYYLRTALLKGWMLRFYIITQDFTDIPLLVN